MDTIIQYIDQHFIGFTIIWMLTAFIIFICAIYINEAILIPRHYDDILYRFRKFDTDSSSCDYLPVNFTYKGIPIKTFVRKEYFKKPEDIKFYACPPEVNTLYINDVPVYCIYRLKGKRVLYWNDEYDLTEARSIIKYWNKEYCKRLCEKIDSGSKRKSFIYNEPKHGDIKYEKN